MVEARVEADDRLTAVDEVDQAVERGEADVDRVAGERLRDLGVTAKDNELTVDPGVVPGARGRDVRRQERHRFDGQADAQRGALRLAFRDRGGNEPARKGSARQFHQFGTPSTSGGWPESELDSRPWMRNVFPAIAPYGPSCSTTCSERMSSRSSVSVDSSAIVGGQIDVQADPVAEPVRASRNPRARPRPARRAPLRRSCARASRRATPSPSRRRRAQPC